MASATPEKRLLIQSSAGLANRLRVVASAIALSRQREDTSVTVVWSASHDLNATYADLFEPLECPGVSIVERRPRLIGLGDRWQRSHLGRAAYKFGLIDRCSSSFGRAFPEVNANGCQFAFVCCGVGVLATLHECVTPSVWDAFVPTQRLCREIDLVSDSFGPRCVGVHIRRADNTKAIALSPLKRFVEAMEKELRGSPDTRFFLATDSEDVRTACREIFGADKIVTREQVNLARDDRAGVEDAVIDLWCLSRTQKVFGSYWSSFSESAAKIGGVPYTQIVSTEAVAAPV